MKKTKKQYWKSPQILKWLPKFIKECSPSVKDWLRKEDIYLQKNIKKGSMVLDVGCGFGRSIEAITRIAEKVVGIDHTKAVYEKAKRILSKFKNVEVSLEEAENMHFKNNFFDYAICMMNTFGDFGKDKLKILKEMKRVTKKGGKIIISVWSEKTLLLRLKEYKKLGFKIEKIIKDGIIYTAQGSAEQFSKEKLRKIFGNAGLKVKIIKLNPISYICEAVKIR